MACGFQTRLTGSKTDFKERHNKSIYNLFCNLFEYISYPLPDSIIPASVYWKTIDFEEKKQLQWKAELTTRRAYCLQGRRPSQEAATHPGPS